jgi:hypothetical protein
MQPISTILDNFLRGRATYAPMRRVLNVIFSISIAAFLFKRFYFQYELLDISDYKGAINFLINGDFIVPLILFVISHYLTHFIGYIFFALTTTRKSTRWISKIVKIKIKKKDLEFNTAKINKTGLVKLPKIDRSWIMDSYNLLKGILDDKQWKRAALMLKRQTENIQRNFLLLFKSVIVISIYFFSTVQHFGLILYCITIAGLLAGMVFLWYSYLVLDVLPTLIRKIDFEIQQHLATEVIKNEQISS